MKNKMIRNMEGEIHELKTKANALEEAFTLKTEECEELVHAVEEMQSKPTQSMEGDADARVAALLEENARLVAQVRELQAAVEMAESVSASEAFGSELKWTEEIDRLESELAATKADSERAVQKGEEEILGLLQDNTNFRQEIADLERQSDADHQKIAEYEDTIQSLQTALAESKRSALALQDSMMELSHTASQLESDVQSRVSASRGDYEATLAALNEQIAAQTSRTAKAEAEVKKYKAELDEKDAEFNDVLQDLIKSRLEFAQLASEVDEKARIHSELEATVRDLKKRLNEGKKK